MCGLTAPGFVFDILGAFKCRSPRARAGNLEHVHGLTHGVTARPPDHQHVQMCLVKGAVSRLAEKRPIRGTNGQAKSKLGESIIRPRALAMLSSRKGSGTLCSLNERIRMRKPSLELPSTRRIHA